MGRIERCIPVTMPYILTRVGHKTTETGTYQMFAFQFQQLSGAQVGFANDSFAV
jgi:hypothetical protein